MSSATFVTITCPTCGVAGTVPVDALLVSVAVDDDTAAGAVAWTCDDCADLVAAELDWPALLALVTAGVALLDDGADDPLPPHPELPGPGATLTYDDLLTLHELLGTDTWFDQVTAAGCVNP